MIYSFTVQPLSLGLSGACSFSLPSIELTAPARSAYIADVGCRVLLYKVQTNRGSLTMYVLRLVHIYVIYVICIHIYETRDFRLPTSDFPFKFEVRSPKSEVRRSSLSHHYAIYTLIHLRLLMDDVRTYVVSVRY
jgi:hypothetical protein